jgi:NADH:ubiquinone oxidoreductase subunit C
MDKTQLAGFIRSNTGITEVLEGKQFCEITVEPAELHKTAALLREDENLRFNFLACLTGVDWGKELGVVYHLRSTVLNHTIVLKTKTADRDNPVLDSVSDLWKTADFHEREVFDLLGIRFANHPDLRRFFLEDSAGHPLRKDYVDEINIVTK